MVKKYFSKVLLFGEYSVIKNSMALATPYSLFGGQLKFQDRGDNEIIKSDNELKTFAQFLEQLASKDQLPVNIDINSLKFDISQGLIFKSTIPQGYGLGSSGALCAAIYNRYIDDEAKEKNQFDIGRLKNIFSVLEAHFHGASSGFDPLISYLGRPVLVKNLEETITVNLPEYKNGEGAIFLLNTGRSRRTEPLVNLFLEKCSSNHEFEKLCHSVLLPITNGCITSFLERDISSLYEFFREISDFQYRHFTPMIPKLFQEVWKTGLKNEKFYLKLCGAGGGGFLLGMAKNMNDAKSVLANYDTRILYKI